MSSSKDVADSLMKGMEENHSHFPEKLFKKKQVVGEEVSVAVQSLL